MELTSALEAPRVDYPKTTWTPDRRTRALELRALGWSATEIANDLGGFGYTKDGGRCAVIGFLDRAGAANANVEWTPEQIETLRSARSKAWSFKRISVMLGHPFTTTVVMRKAHDIGLPSPRDRINPDRICIRKPKAPTPPPIPPIADLEIPEAQRRTILELEEHHCRWPIGEPNKPDFFFCGAARVESAPYCAAHSLRAFS